MRSFCSGMIRANTVTAADFARELGVRGDGVGQSPVRIVARVEPGLAPDRRGRRG